MPPRPTASPAMATKRSFDMPRYEEFKALLAERDSSPAMFIRRTVLDYLDKKTLTLSYLKAENKELLFEIAKGLRTVDMHFALENALDELRRVRRK